MLCRYQIVAGAKGLTRNHPIRLHIIKLQREQVVQTAEQLKMIPVNASKHSGVLLVQELLWTCFCGSGLTPCTPTAHSFLKSFSPVLQWVGGFLLRPLAMCVGVDVCPALISPIHGPSTPSLFCMSLNSWLLSLLMGRYWQRGFWHPGKKSNSWIFTSFWIQT